MRSLIPSGADSPSFLTDIPCPAQNLHNTPPGGLHEHSSTMAWEQEDPKETQDTFVSGKSHQNSLSAHDNYYVGLSCFSKGHVYGVLLFPGS